MKKFILFGITVFACACLFALDAEVTALEGKAQVSTNGTTWTPLAVGNKISQGATIQTGFKSQLKLKVKGSEITLDAMTRIKVDQLSEQGNVDNTVVSMKIGSLTSNVKKVEDRRAGFTVKGPAATASVRGTIVSEEVGYNRDTVSAIENTTMVWPSSANDEGDASGEAPAAAARAIAPGQKASVDNHGGERAPQSHASLAAFDLGGAPESAAAAEAVAAAGADAGGFSSGQASNSNGAEISPTNGTIVVNVTFAEN